MKKTKHIFKHTDPEKSQSIEKPGKKVPRKINLVETNIKKDLKKTTVTILIFLVIIAALYFLNTELNWFQLIKDLLQK